LVTTIAELTKTGQRSYGQVNAKDKRGEGGWAIDLIGNFFTLISMPNWKLNQFRVDFKPEQDNTAMAK
jgi:hypothetical protein